MKNNKSDWRQLQPDGKTWHYLTDDDKTAFQALFYGLVYIFGIPTADGLKFYCGSHSIQGGAGWNYWSSGVKVQQHIADHGTAGITRNIVAFYHDEYDMLYAEKQIQIENRAADSPRWMNRIYGDARIGTVAGAELREYMSVVQRRVDRSGGTPNYSGYGVYFETSEGNIWFPSNKVAKERLGLSHCAISNWIARPDGYVHRKPKNKAIKAVYRCTRKDAAVIPGTVLYDTGEVVGVTPKPQESANIFDPATQGAGVGASQNGTQVAFVSHKQPKTQHKSPVSFTAQNKSIPFGLEEDE